MVYQNIPDEGKFDDLRVIFQDLQDGEKISERIYFTLRKAILYGILPPGANLGERDIASILHVSRTPVREALQRLIQEGFIITNKSSKRMSVFQLDIKDIEDIYDIRVGLESIAARLAAERATDIDLLALEDILQMEYENKNDLKLQVELNAKFHNTIAMATRNPKLKCLISIYHDLVQTVNYTSLRYKGRIDQALKEHEKIFNALRNRDAELAMKAAIEHMENGKKVRIKLLLQQHRPVKNV